MNADKIAKNRLNSLLVVFVLINIIGDIGNIIAWYVSPSMQSSIIGGNIGGVEFKGGYLFGVAGANATLAIGSAILAIVSVVYIVSLAGLLKKQKWGPQVVIAISIINRVIAVFLFEFSAAFAFWAIWTVILVAVSYLDYRKLAAPAPLPTQAQM